MSFTDVFNDLPLWSKNSAYLLILSLVCFKPLQGKDIGDQSSCTLPIDFHSLVLLNLYFVQLPPLAGTDLDPLIEKAFEPWRSRIMSVGTAFRAFLVDKALDTRLYPDIGVFSHHVCLPRVQISRTVTYLSALYINSRRFPRCSGHRRFLKQICRRPTHRAPARIHHIPCPARCPTPLLLGAVGADYKIVGTEEHVDWAVGEMTSLPRCCMIGREYPAAVLLGNGVPQGFVCILFQMAKTCNGSFAKFQRFLALVRCPCSCATLDLDPLQPTSTARDCKDILHPEQSSCTLPCVR